jgi:hypothetical protein
MVKIHQKPGKVRYRRIRLEPRHHGDAGLSINDLDHASHGMRELPKRRHLIPPVIRHLEITVQDQIHTHPQ